MNSWVMKPLGAVIELQRGHDLPFEDRRVGVVPIIGSFGVTGFHDQAKYAGPGVAIGRSGASIGRATYVEGDYWPLNTALFVKDFKGNVPYWTYLALRRIDFTGFNSGSAQPSLNRNFLGDIPVMVPPRQEQEGIAEVLGALDDKIAANCELVGTAESLMVALAEDLPRTAPLAGIAELVKHQVSVDALAGLGEVSHYSLPAFDQHRLPVQEAGEAIKSGKFHLERAVVLLSKLNPRIPRVWNVAVPEQNAVASTEFLVLSPRNLPTAALWAVLAGTQSRSYMQERAAGTSGSHQRVRPVDAMAMPVPDEGAFSQDLLAQLESLGAVAQATREESRTLAELRDTLLPALMDGTIRVKDAVAAAEEVL
jgi:type I restriction enzyme S subunit